MKCKAQWVIVSKLLLFVFFLIVTGCASPAKPTAMIPNSFDIKNTHPYLVSVEVGGGKETNPLWTSQISNEAFLEAITKSITESGVFTKVITGEDADYLLEVVITSLTQPIVGFDLTVNMISHWKLSKVGTKEQVWSEFISSSQVLSSFLCKIFISQFFEERQILTHFSDRVRLPV
jgi:hypothetical protein